MLPSLPAAPARRSPASRRRAVRWSFGVLLLAAAVVGVGPAVVGLGNSALAGVVGVVAALAWTTFELYGRAHAVDRSQPTLAELAEQLAAVVQLEWRHEAQVRRLRDTQVLPLVWTTREQLADTPTEVFGRDAGRVTRLNLHGQLEEDFDNAIRQLAEGFTRLPNQRLVVLGEPGAGKTVLALLLTLGLLRDRAPGSHVPVLLSVSSWDPVVETLDDWLVQALATAYYGGRSAIARQLLDADLLLPILDGLDEIPESARRSAVGAINYAIRRRRPVVVTCRSAEYQDVIRGGAPVLRRAPVVEVEPVAAEDAIAYLRTIDGPAGTRWERVYAHLRQADVAPDSPVGLALSTPLMVSLAGLVYQRVGGDPGELLKTDRFDTRHKVEDHLTDWMIEAAYSPEWVPGGTVPADAVPRWTADRARTWLTSLAQDMHRHRDRDLAWWLISQRMLSPWVAPGIGLGTGLLLLTIVAAWVSAFDRGANDSDTRLYWTLLVGGGVGTGFAVIAMIVWYANAGRQPGRLSFRLRGSLHRIRRGFTAGLLITGVPAAAVFAVTAAVITLSYSWTVQAIDNYARAVAGATLAAALIGLALALHNWVDAPPERAARADPLDAIRQDRRSSMAGAGVAAAVVAVGLLPVTATGMAIGSLVVQALTDWAGWPGERNGWLTVRAQWTAARSFVPSSGLVLVGASSALPGVVVALSVLLVRAWPRFLIARTVLAAQRRLPLALPAFLDDARRRGVLRLTGGVYQFRHVRLQERLAAGPNPDGLSRPRMAPAGRPRPRRLWRFAIALSTLTVAGATALTVLPKNKADHSIRTTYATEPEILVNDEGTMLVAYDRPSPTIHIDWIDDRRQDSDINRPGDIADVDVDGVTISPDGNTIAVVGTSPDAEEGESQRLRLWRRDGDFFAPVDRWDQRVPPGGHQVRFLAGGALLLVRTTAQTPRTSARLWHLPDEPGEPRPVNKAPEGLDQATFSDDGRLAVLPGPGAESRLWVPAPPQEGNPPRHRLVPLTEGVTDLEFIQRRPKSQEPPWLITQDAKDQMYLRDHSGRVKEPLGKIAETESLSFAVTSDQNGTWLAVRSTPTVVQLWELDNAPRQRRKINVSESATSIQLDPTGRWLVAAEKRSIVLYETASDDPPVYLRLDGNRDSGPSFNTNGTVLTVEVELSHALRTQHWIVDDQPTEWTTPSNVPYDPPLAAFTPDGCQLVQGGYDGVLRIWNLGEPRPIELAGHAAPIVKVLVPSNATAATAAADGTVRLWTLPKSGPACR